MSKPFYIDCVLLSKDNAYVDQDLTMIQVMVAAPKASPPIVRNKLNMIFSPFFRISDITVFLSYDSVMQTTAKPTPVPTTVDMISVATRAVKPNIFIFSFHRFFAEFASIIVSALLSFSIREQVQHRLLRQQDIPELQYMPYHSPHCFYYNISNLASSLQFPLFSDVCLFFTRRCGYRQSDINVSIPLAAFFDVDQQTAANRAAGFFESCLGLFFLLWSHYITPSIAKSLQRSMFLKIIFLCGT